MASIFPSVRITKEPAAGRFVFTMLEPGLSRAKEENGFKRISRGCGGGESAVI